MFAVTQLPLLGLDKFIGADGSSEISESLAEARVVRQLGRYKASRKRVGNPNPL
jgi:hypothetical protein